METLSLHIGRHSLVSVSIVVLSLDTPAEGSSRISGPAVECSRGRRTYGVLRPSLPKTSLLRKLGG